MNTVNEFLNAIPDDDLKIAVAEMKELDESATLKDGVVLRLGKELAQHAGIGSANARKVIETAVFRIAAYRWAGV
jgi:hypothetical protein